jgi:hypothetical protein
MRVESPVNALVGWLDRTGLDQILGPIMDSLHRLRGLVGHTQVHLIPGISSLAYRNLLSALLIGIPFVSSQRGSIEAPMISWNLTRSNPCLNV